MEMQIALYSNFKCLRFILPEILDYLVIKKPIAKLMIKFLEGINHGTRGDYSGDQLKLFQEIRALNKKGPIENK